MLIVGLTGSVGMGKSTLAAHLRKQGIGVFDADAEVHRMYAGSAAPLIEAAFPGTVSDGVVDRRKLSDILARDASGFRRLEAIVHPLVKSAEREFLAGEKARGAGMAVLEVPLLFETGANAQVDAVILASAPDDMRRERVLQRPGMTVEKLEMILARQSSDVGKRARADFVVETGLPIGDTLAQLDGVIAKLHPREGKAYALHWA